MTIPKTAGLVAAPFTPFRANGELDLARIDAYPEFLASQGVIGGVVCGTTGEGPSLTLDERRKVAERWVAAAPRDFRVIVNVGSTCLADCRSLADHAESIGAGGIACLAPYFFHAQGVPGLVNWCHQVAAAAPTTPFFYYHFPAITHFTIRASDFLEAAADRIPTLAGVKFTNEAFDDLSACLACRDGRFDVMFGRDEKLLAGLEAGAVGAVGSTYNFAAPLYQRLIAAWRRGDLQTARATQTTATRLIEAVVASGVCPLGGFKWVMGRMGFDCGPVRPPLWQPTPGQLDLVEAAVAEAGLMPHAMGPVPA